MGTKGGHAFLEDLIESTDFSKEEAVIDFVEKLYSSTTHDIDNICQTSKRSHGIESTNRKP
jgi:hypothetical protein